MDNLVLAAVADEAQRLVGAVVERVWETGPRAVCLGTWSDEECWLLLCASPGQTRAHLLASRPRGPRAASPFAAAVLKHLEGAAVTSVAVRGDDRILDLWLDQEGQTWILVAELTGRMPNLLLLDPARNVVAAAQWLGPARSARPVVPKRPYAPPPGAPPLPEAPVPRGGLGRPSPFALRLETLGVDVRGAWARGEWRPCLSPGNGAYPLDLAPLGIECQPAASLSRALERHFSEAAGAEALERSRSSLLGQLRRVVLAREVALREVEEAALRGARAHETQADAELLLAYAAQMPEGATEVVLPGYDGLERSVRLDPGLDAVGNAQRLFAKAKAARARLQGLGPLAARFREELEGLKAALAQAEAADADALEGLRERCRERGWLATPGTAKPKAERPFGGHAVRETVSPGGWRVLYGENATANDYLTTKVSRPRDLWFHVRGAPSAHVVIATDNQPTKVQKPDILFAARLAVEKSPLKHSGYVSVDYTERRYVRKPRGSAPGLAVYTHERTVHVER